MESKTSEFAKSAILLAFYLLFIVSIFHVLSRHVMTFKNTSNGATEVDSNMIFAWRWHLMTYITSLWCEVVSTRQFYWLKHLVILMERIYMCSGETDEVTEEWRSTQGGKNKNHSILSRKAFGKWQFGRPTERLQCDILKEDNRLQSVNGTESCSIIAQLLTQLIREIAQSV
jgi:hypothetical protein